MATHEETLDTVLAKLVKDVEMAVHALYRGDVRQQTAKAKTEVHRQVARKVLASLVGNGRPSGAVLTAPAAGGELSADEVAAITRCIMAWLPMGPPTDAAESSRCVPAGRELAPSWGDRERAHQAMRRVGNH
jgi:hypothetical protein